MSNVWSRVKRLVPFSSEGMSRVRETSEEDPRLEGDGDCWIQLEGNYTRQISIIGLGDVQISEKGYSKVPCKDAIVLQRELDDIEIVDEPESPGEVYPTSGVLENGAPEWAEGVDFSSKEGDNTTCPLCGTEGFRMDTAARLYRCDTDDCRVTQFREEREHT